MRLLVVEDERELAKQIAEALRAAGYAVDVAHDGEEGQYLGEVEPYDAVILDLGLPKIDGLSAAVKKLTSDDRPEVVASAVEFVLEGLHLSRRLNCERTESGAIYRR